MLNAFPPYFIVLAFGLIAAGSSVFIVLIVFLVKHLSKKREQPYEVETSVRIVAFLIDLYIISFVYIIIRSLLFFIETGYTYYLTFLFPNIIFQAAYNIFNFLYYPFLLIIQIFPYSLEFLSLQSIFYIFLPYIIGFLYFFIFETALKGKTLGFMIFRIKSVSVKNRSLKFYEVILNSLGKSFFCVIDLIIGLIVFASVKKPDGALTKSKQIRLMQRLAGAVVIRTPRPLPY